MRINVHLTDEDYIKFNIYFAFNSKQGKRQVLINRLIGPGICALVFGVFFMAGADKDLLTVEAVVLSFIALLLFISAPKWIVKSIRKNCSKFREEGEFPYDEDAVIDFGETEILSTSAKGTEKVLYSDIHDIGEDEDNVYLRKGAMEALIIPDCCLPEGRSAFLEFIREKCDIT